MRNQRLELYTLPDYMPRKNKSNNYGFNLEEQKSQTYTGMGEDINVHDQWAVESQGAIQDRTKEHLARSDVGIITYRRLLRKAIAQVQQGIPPLLVLGADLAQEIRGPEAVDAFGKVGAWENSWREWDQKRRRNSPWAANGRLAEHNDQGQ
jgi:hypothetical protein